MNDELMTLDDIAQTLKLRREYVRDRLSKRPDFPRPAVQISQKHRLWALADLHQWQARQQVQAAR